MEPISFYSYTQLPADGDAVKYSIQLNADHEIFKGHFPTQPVLPGACMLQIVKQVTASYLGKTIQLVKAGNIKFLSFVDPKQSATIQLLLKVNTIDGQFKVDAQLIDKETTVFKFGGTFAEK
jgi:3-hydroxyacyl-[acyl-carrier-protein] dehydratase